MENIETVQTVSDEPNTETQSVTEAPVTQTEDLTATLSKEKAEKDKLIKENVERKKLNKSLEAKTLELEQNHQLTLAEKEKIQSEYDSLNLKITDLETENSILKSKAEAFDKIQIEKKTNLLSTISEELRTEFADMPLEKIESIIAKMPKSGVANSFGAAHTVPSSSTGAKTAPKPNGFNSSNPLDKAAQVAPNIY